MPKGRRRPRSEKEVGERSADLYLVLRDDMDELIKEFRSAGVPIKLLASITRKCLRTPRRQTGRVDRRTNREPRWKIALDHPDYSSEMDAHLVMLRLLLDSVRMRNAPAVNQELVAAISSKYFGKAPPNEVTRDPVTDEELDWNELVDDVVEKPKHGYSRFHIGHQDPRTQPKHLPQNIRWQLKASNDFQDGMDIRVARIAYSIDQLTRTGDPHLVEEITQAFALLCQELGVGKPQDIKIEPIASASAGSDE